MVQKNCLDKYNSIIILGPTASGKTKVSIDLALALNGEIISADSMQFYKGLDIGTAKATKEEQEKVPHHLIDCLELEDSYNVAQFRMDVEDCCRQLWKKGKLPIIVGGSGFYVQTLTNPEFDKIDINLEQQKKVWEEKLTAEYTPDEWYTMLEQHNQELAKSVHPNNHKRVLNYLIKSLIGIDGEKKEYYESKSLLCPLIIVLEPERDVLYERINHRVDQMLNEGVLQEADMLLHANLNPKAQCLSAIGYKELFPYLKGEDTLEHCVEVLKQKTRNYAKRQLTWIRHQVKDAVVFNPTTHPDITNEIKTIFEKGR